MLLLAIGVVELFLTKTQFFLQVKKEINWYIPHFMKLQKIIFLVAHCFYDDSTGLQPAPNTDLEFVVAGALKLNDNNGVQAIQVE